jgi:hypothetical protein
MENENHGLPESLDGNVPRPSARTRQNNWPTHTVDATFASVPHRDAFDAIDLVQPTLDFVKIIGGAFTGKAISDTGRGNISFKKFLIILWSIIKRAVLSLPRALDAVNLTKAIFTELRAGEEPPEYITEYNQLVFDVLQQVCDDEALNIVLRYEYADNGTRTRKKDGRRALFALMQTYAPISTSASNNAKDKLDAFHFGTDKNKIRQQIADFHTLIDDVETARGSKLGLDEFWSFVTSTIKGHTWALFRLTMSMQSEFKAKRSFWFIDQVREYVLDRH